MRLKTFTAASMTAAMAKVREELGDDAIIVSSREGDGITGVEVVAALESSSTTENFDSLSSGDELDALQDILDYHRTPPHLVDRLYGAARVLETNDTLLALAGALDAGFTFMPLTAPREARALMFVGPPGAGKTVAVAKLAARAVVARRSAAMITTDTLRTGAIEQLTGYATLLGLRPRIADGAGALSGALAEANGAAIKLIDTTGANPFDATDMGRLRDLVEASAAEPILVLPAGMDPDEAAETAEAFAALGTSRLLATRLDTARRLGGVLAAAAAAGLRLCEAGTGPHIGDSLNPLSPLTLARALAAAPADRIATLSPNELMP